jgi:Immunity protein 22
MHFRQGFGPSERRKVMEEEGAVSLWLGTSNSIDEFEKALDVTFSQDGDFLGSPFSRAFGIDYYEEGLREAEYYDQPSSDLRQLLSGASYESVIVDRFRSLGTPTGSFNCVVLLYNYHHEMPAEWTNHGVFLQFFGTVRYQ